MDGQASQRVFCSNWSAAYAPALPHAPVRPGRADLATRPSQSVNIKARKLPHVPRHKITIHFDSTTLPLPLFSALLLARWTPSRLLVIPI
jgi:hypothetical protein